MAKKSLFEQSAGGPVECLGMKFKNDDARREYFLGKLREKLKDPAFRKIEGFPIGKDEDILALSDPPYYTACPNPFVGEFIKYHCKTYDPKQDDYHQEPFAADVSEGKTDPIYTAHTYHTKVPPKAIEQYLEHYTQPGDVILDCFCGSGMTGVAAERLPKRHAVLVDLSPAATFIAANYLTPVDTDELHREAEGIIARLKSELGWMFETNHHGKPAVIDYVIWSDILLCSECSKEIVFWEAAVDWEEGEKGIVATEFKCSHCHALVTKRNLVRAFETVYDPFLRQSRRSRKMVPVKISYRFAGQKYQKQPDDRDLELIRRVGGADIASWVPTDLFMSRTGPWGDLWRGYHEGFTHVHHFCFRRNLAVLARFLELSTESSHRPQLIAGLTAVLKYSGYQNRISPSSTMGLFRTMSGTLYLGSILGEVNLIDSLKGRFSVRKLKAFYSTSRRSSCISTCSATGLQGIGANCIDYAFVDPPFGDNLPYSELNFLWESWLRVKTQVEPEAIVSGIQGKGVLAYGKLMERCFKEVYRTLKPGRWMTVEFHNSRNAIWTAIQEALLAAGFVVADVRILDKGNILTKKQITGPNAVNKDLAISAYKPSAEIEDRFRVEAGTDSGMWSVVRGHLAQLPVFVMAKGEGEVIAERQNHLLFDRMVAFHVQRGVGVPMSAAQFYAGLAERFPERDGMYFLPEQAAEYDRKRMSVEKMTQLELFVLDEATAIKWLRRELTAKPQTFQELQPQFMQELAGWQKHEQTLELSVLLEQNFLCYGKEGPVPPQIHAYLSSNFKELRNLDDDDLRLVAKAKDRWYVPNPAKGVDLEQIRLRALLKEFRQYQESKGRLKVVRTEALRAGFKECWQRGDYAAIVQQARRLPDEIIQEDPTLLMYYDNAVMRTENTEWRLTSP
jgi:DNA modification methylase